MRTTPWAASMTSLLSFPSPLAAAVTAPVLSDAADRDAALDIRRSFIVEAPAGSGKTGLLLQRYLKLLADPELREPEEIVAATFTRKATHELRERILAQLRAAARREPRGDASAEPLSPFDRLTASLADAALAHDRLNGWGLLDRPQRLTIRTLDALAGETVRSLPSATGSTLATPVEDPDELYGLAAERTLLQLGGEDTALSAALRTVLLHRNGNLSNCRDLIASMLATREQWGDLMPLDPERRTDARLDTETRSRLERALEAIVCTGLSRAVRLMPPPFLNELITLSERLSVNDGYRGAVSPIAVCRGRSAPGERADDLDHWLVLADLLLTKAGTWRKSFSVNVVGFVSSPQEKAELKGLIDSVADNNRLCRALNALRCLPPTRYPDDQWHVAKALFHVLVRAMAELEVLFAERDTTDFPAITLAARAAVGGQTPGAEFSAGYGTRLRHLLLDEMQDTSAAQYDLIAGLTHSWDGASQTLFLVGDPKQSIYAFRQARVERFLRTRRERRLGSVPLTCLTLTANFRSSPALVNSFNELFRQVFPTAGSPDAESLDGDALDVPFVEATATRTAQPRQATATWHATVVTDLPTPEVPAENDAASARRTLHREREAAAIAQIAAEWRGRPLPPDRQATNSRAARPWTMAVLVRGRAHAADIFTAMRAERIPFRAVDLEPLGRRPEVLDLLALTRALQSPGDRTAWLAILHAPWCGLGLADLLAISGGGAAEAAHQALPFVVAGRCDLLSNDGRPHFDRAWAVLEAALAQRGRLPLAELVERTWRSLGGDAPLTPDARINAARFLRLLQELEMPGPRVELSRLTRRLRGLFAEPDNTPGAVEILTMHKSKGLEWDVVCLAGLERKPNRDNARLLDWLERDTGDAAQAHVLLAPVRSSEQDEDAPLNAWMKNVRRERTRAEAKRLLYVAATRAREALHLFAAVERSTDAKSDKAFNFDPDSLLAAAWPAVGGTFEALASAAPAANVALTAGDRLAASLAATPLPGPRLVAEPEESEVFAPLALAAAADGSDADAGPAQELHRPPLLHRLPLSFDPLARLAGDPRLANLGQLMMPVPAARPPMRPEGSYEARALGNVVHRYLQWLAERLAAAPRHDESVNALHADVESWGARLLTSLRAEGITPAAAQRAAAIARRALLATLSDIEGRWLLLPHAAAQNELKLRSASEGSSGVRIDRTFLAGAAPGQPGSTHRWIVDWKTGAQSSAVPAHFAESERAKYGPQLERYADTLAALEPGTPIVLALYYPLIPRLITWPAARRPVG